MFFLLEAIEALRPGKFRPDLGDWPADRADYPMRVRYYEDVVAARRRGHWRAWREVQVEQLNAELAIQFHSLSQKTDVTRASLRRLYTGLRVMTLLVIGADDAVRLVSACGLARAQSQRRFTGHEFELRYSELEFERAASTVASAHGFAATTFGGSGVKSSPGIDEAIGLDLVLLVVQLPVAAVAARSARDASRARRSRRLRAPESDRRCGSSTAGAR